MRSMALRAGGVLSLVGAYVTISGITGFCPMCEFAVSNVAAAVGVSAQESDGDVDGEHPSQRRDDFERVQRPGGVDLEEEYDVSNAKIPLDEIHSLLPRDRIPALTNPKRESIKNADTWLDSGHRIIAVTVDGETVGAPLPILDFHEIANMVVGGEPVAATYCPLCDSATVFSRVVPVETPSGRTRYETLEFGVSGALFNSNVLMYDRTHLGLWSQLGMRAVSGPMAGTQLRHLPTRVLSWSDFKSAHPDAEVLSRDTGHERPYGESPYDRYFRTDRLMVPVKEMGDAMERKTLGAGVAIGDEAWFVTADAIGDGYTLKTPAGPVRLSTSEGGIVVESAPPEAKTAQTFYYSWTAFYPRAEIISRP